MWVGAGWARAARSRCQGTSWSRVLNQPPWSEALRPHGDGAHLPHPPASRGLSRSRRASTWSAWLGPPSPASAQPPPARQPAQITSNKRRGQGRDGERWRRGGEGASWQSATGLEAGALGRAGRSGRRPGCGRLRPVTLPRSAGGGAGALEALTRWSRCAPLVVMPQWRGIENRGARRRRGAAGGGRRKGGFRRSAAAAAALISMVSR